MDFECRGEARLARPVYNSRVVKIDAATDGTEQRLPLEGKLAQRQLRLMRSKLSIITAGWYYAVNFDLIRHARRRDTFPSRGRLWPVLRRQPLPPLIRPPVRVATFPQGKALLRRSAGFTIL